MCGECVFVFSILCTFDVFSCTYHFHLVRCILLNRFYNRQEKKPNGGLFRESLFFEIRTRVHGISRHRLRSSRAVKWVRVNRVTTVCRAIIRRLSVVVQRHSSGLYSMNSSAAAWHDHMVTLVTGGRGGDKQKRFMSFNVSVINQNQQSSSLPLTTFNRLYRALANHFVTRLTKQISLWLDCRLNVYVCLTIHNMNICPSIWHNLYSYLPISCRLISQEQKKKKSYWILKLFTFYG